MRWTSAACAAMAACCAFHAAGAAGATGDGGRFDQVFSTRGEPSATHFEATYRAGGQAHRLEVWRDGERRVRRRTDDVAESYAVRVGTGPDYELSMLDLKRRIHTRIGRDNLYRIGQFSDWFDLGHGLRHPKGAYGLAAAGAPPGTAAPLAPCHWFDLSQEGRTTHVCWSARSRLPLLMVGQDGAELWRVTRVDHRAIPAATFAIHDQGFIRNDANADIERD